MGAAEKRSAARDVDVAKRLPANFGEQLMEAFGLLVRQAVREELAHAQPANTVAGPEPEYLKSKDVAKRLSCSIRQVQKMAAEGMPHIFVGREMRFRPADVEKWSARRKGGG